MTPREDRLEAECWKHFHRANRAERERDALVAERDRIAAERDEALASVVLYVNERDAARDGWEAQVRSEEREMRRRIEAEARADNLAPYVMRSQAAQARVAALTEALRHLIEWADDERGDAFGEREWADARAALAAADRPEGETPQEGNA